MASDRSRISYDEKQQYRSVVSQQGRVTLADDENEAKEIFYDEIRKEALDFVGPSGTPDNGYGVIVTGQRPSPPFDFSTGASTMYVGGLRTELDTPVQYSQQQDWLDHSSDPDWVDPSYQEIPPVREFIYLYLREQEVSAVEDSALREVALGGPDTTARTRLLQHIVRFGLEAADYTGALTAAQARWASEGLSFDGSTMRLLSQATLQVGFSSPGGPPNPCEPQAQGG